MRHLDYPADQTRVAIGVLDRAGVPYLIPSDASLGVLPETYYQVVDEFGYDPLSKDPTR